MGISFTVYTESGNIDRAWPFDLIPRIIRAREWRKVSAGLKQRSRALNAFIEDVYNEQRILREGIVPGELIEQSAQRYEVLPNVFADAFTVHVALAPVKTLRRRDVHTEFCVTARMLFVDEDGVLANPLAPWDVRVAVPRHTVEELVMVLWRRGHDIQP